MKDRAKEATKSIDRIYTVCTNSQDVAKAVDSTIRAAVEAETNELREQLRECREALGELHIGVVALLLAEQDERSTIKCVSQLLTEALTRASNNAAAVLAKLKGTP